MVVESSLVTVGSSGLDLLEDWVNSVFEVSAASVADVEIPSLGDVFTAVVLSSVEPGSSVETC